jgi:hypothetical protein
MSRAGGLACSCARRTRSRAYAATRSATSASVASGYSGRITEYSYRVSSSTHGRLGHGPTDDTGHRAD